MAFLYRTGYALLSMADHTGGMLLVWWRMLKRLFRFQLDRDEFWRFGSLATVETLPVASATAAFAGLIMVLQSAVYFRQFGVSNLVGWFAGFTVLRELTPLLLGLIFSGRVGASHTSELATMRINEELDALDVLVLDVYELFLLPRAVAMILAMGALVVIGDIVSLLVGAGGAWFLLGVEPRTFYTGLVNALGPADFLLGIAKALAYGGVIAVVSTHFGLRASGGSEGVGRAVNAQVVASAIGLFLTDYLMTLGGR